MYKTRENFTAPLNRFIRLKCNEFEDEDIDSLNDPEFHEFKGRVESYLDISKYFGYREGASRLKKLLDKSL